MNLDFITKNPLIKNLALGKLKEACKENGITLIAVIPDPETGELKFETYSEAVVVVTKQKLSDLINLAVKDEQPKA